EAGADGSAVWDDRWRLLGLPPGARVTATTPAALAARDWRGAGLPRVALLAAPAVEAGGRTLLPLLDPGAGVTATPLRGRADWLAILRAH
ncbi:tRNA lysidine(34) synthetase TilS, partial [Paracoccus panacisoli]